MLGRAVSLLVSSLLAVGAVAPAVHATTIDGSGHNAVTSTTPMSPLKVGSIRHLRLPVNQWSWITVPVRLRVPVDRLVLEAHGRDLRTRTVRLRDVQAGVHRVPILVLLEVREERRVQVVVRAVGDFRRGSKATGGLIEPRR